MTRRVYGNPAEFQGGVHVGSCYRDEMGFVKVMACANTPDGLHCFHLTEHEWALLYKEVKETFADGPEPEADELLDAPAPRAHRHLATV